MISNKTKYNVILNGNDIHMMLSLPSLFFNVVNLHFFRYNQSKFGVSITSFPAIIYTSKFEQYVLCYIVYNIFCSICSCRKEMHLTGILKFEFSL